jgi:hypothetical protein
VELHLVSLVYPSLQCSCHIIPENKVLNNSTHINSLNKGCP